MMRMIFLCIVGAVSLSACAQTPQEAAAYRQFGMQMLAAQAQADAVQAQQCDSMKATMKAMISSKSPCLCWLR